MSLIKCEECSSDISESALSCPKCGCITKQKKINDERNKIIITRICIYSALIVILGLVIKVQYPVISEANKNIAKYTSSEYRNHYEKLWNKKWDKSDEKVTYMIYVEKHEEKLKNAQSSIYFCVFVLSIIAIIDLFSNFIFVDNKESDS